MGEHNYLLIPTKTVCCHYGPLFTVLYSQTLMNALRVATLAIKPVQILLAVIGVAASKGTFWQQIIKIARVSDI